MVGVMTNERGGTYSDRHAKALVVGLEEAHQSDLPDALSLFHHQ